MLSGKNLSKEWDEHYHTILASNDSLNIEDLFNKIFEVQKENGPEYGIVHILVRSFEILKFFPTYGYLHSVSGRTDPTRLEIEEDKEGLWESTIKHYHPMSKLINYHRLVLRYYETISKKKYEKNLLLRGHLSDSI